VLSTIEPTANREDYYEDQGYQNCQHNQLYLHVLQPHFSTDFGPRILEVLCLPQKMDESKQEAETAHF